MTLGLPLSRVWFGIVLPQAVIAVMPMLGNLIVAMFKETAILSTITIMELLAQGRAIGSIEFRYIEPLTLVGVLYFIVSYTAARAFAGWKPRMHHMTTPPRAAAASGERRRADARSDVHAKCLKILRR